MIKALIARLHQGHRTARYPRQPPALPDRFRGAPRFEPARCPAGCADCAKSCPVDAIELRREGPRLDLGRCLFCTECSRACSTGALELTTEHRLSALTRDELWTSGQYQPKAAALSSKMLSLFGRSLKLRQVSAGGCNACEADINVLSTLVFDLGRFGVQVVASPRHADGLLVTGPVTENMREALEKTYAAVPAPKIVIAVGACAISGGAFAGHPQVHDGVGGVLPVDLFIPGCPPHPYTILDGLLTLLGRLSRDGTRRGAAPEATTSG
jgi:Ni,Fe-hydrogenase III small subunit